MTDPAKSLPIFIAKMFLVIILTCFILMISGELFARFTPWQKYMDPRQRILWDNIDAKYVLLGDSVFCSYYVNSPDRTIWGRVKYHSGHNMFPASLNGAKTDDILNATKILSRSLQTDSIVFIDIIPTRFTYTNLVEPVVGNYNYSLRRLTNDLSDTKNTLMYLKNNADYYLAKISFLFRNKEALKNLITGIDTPPKYYNTDPHYNRVWNKDGDFAAKRFETFRQNAIYYKGLKPFAWTLILHKQLSERGIKAVFVLTPLNKDLIHTLTSKTNDSELVTFLDKSHSEFSNFMAKNGMHSIDLYNSANSNEFADMIHTNEQGDDRIALSIVNWIRQHQLYD